VFDISLQDTLNIVPAIHSHMKFPLPHHGPGRALPCPPAPDPPAAFLPACHFHPEPLTGLLPARAPPSRPGPRLSPCPQAGLSSGNCHSHPSETGRLETLHGYRRGSRVLGMNSPECCQGFPQGRGMTRFLPRWTCAGHDLPLFYLK